MKWLDKWFYRKARWCWKRAGYEYPELKLEQDIVDRCHEQANQESILHCRDEVLVSGNEHDPHDLYDGIRIDVKKLNGGYIVTFRHPYRESKTINELPRSNSYIISEQEDLTQRLGSLLTLELLKNG